MGKHLPRKIQLEREQKRLEDLAQRHGFSSFAEWLRDLYIVQKVPIQKISEQLFTPMWTLRKKFDELGINVRTRGGPNHVHIHMTEELYQEVCRDGIPAVCERLGVEYMALRRRLVQYHKEHHDGETTPTE